MAQSALMRQYLDILSEKSQEPTYDKEQYIGWAKKYSDQYKVPLSMVLHAMFNETGWKVDPNKMRVAVSPTGATGIMQIQPQYAEKGAYKIKVKDLLDPEKNIEAGVRGLAYFLQKTGDPRKALAAYNAGEGGASEFIKTGDINTLRSKETKNYIKNYKDDVVHQIEKFYPNDKNKVSQIATNILATAVGANDAQAADAPNSQTIQDKSKDKKTVPTPTASASDGQGGPDKKLDRSTAKNAKQPGPAEIAKINQQLQNSKDPVKELEKIIQQMREKGQEVGDLTQQLKQLKQDHDKDMAKLGRLPDDDPNSTYVNLGPIRLKVDGKLTSPKFPSVQSDIPSGSGTDYQNQGDNKPAPAGSKTASRRTAVPTEVPAVDDFGRVIQPSTVTKAKTVNSTEPQVSNARVQPTAQDLDAVRKITGNAGPMIDPFTGQPTTEKALKAKIEKMQQDRAEAEKAAADERNRIANAERSKFASQDPRRVDRSTDTSAVGKTVKSTRVPDADSLRPGEVIVAPSVKTKKKEKSAPVDTSIGRERRTITIGGVPVTIGSEQDYERNQAAQRELDRLRKLAGDDLEKLQAQTSDAPDLTTPINVKSSDLADPAAPAGSIQPRDDAEESEYEKLIRDIIAREREISEDKSRAKSTDLLRSYMDLLNEAEQTAVPQPAPQPQQQDPMTRRVTVNPDGSYSGGFKPSTVPDTPEQAAERQQRLQAWQAQQNQPKPMSDDEYQHRLNQYKMGGRGAGYGFKPRPEDEADAEAARAKIFGNRP